MQHREKASNLGKHLFQKQHQEEIERMKVEHEKITDTEKKKMIEMQVNSSRASHFFFL